LIKFNLRHEDTQRVVLTVTEVTCANTGNGELVEAGLGVERSVEIRKLHLEWLKVRRGR